MIGEKINDRYKILSRIGDGGMAVVYKAKDLILDRVVAVKILRSEYASNEEFIRRFRREAESVASLSDPNIVSIYDIGEEEDCYYIVMEYVDGVTLKTYIKNHGPVDIGLTVEIIKQIAQAIEHAHQHGIVHRDIKPHNILINENHDIKVTDFGIALAMTSATITFTNSIIGSAHYLSPEQAKGGKGTVKSDVYALGIVLFEMLTGQLPFPGDSPVSVALKHINEPVPRPKVLRPDLPQSLDNILMKTLTKNPDERYDSIGAFYDDLSSALNPERWDEPPWYPVQNEDDDGETTKVLPATLAANNQEPRTDLSESSPAKNEKKKKKSRKKPVIITIIILLLLLGTAGAVYAFLPNLFFVDDVTVPDLKGKKYEEAVDILRDKHLYVVRETVTSKKYKKGVVAEQNPNPDKVIKENTSVTLFVSKGPKKGEVPLYEGMTKSMVEQLITEGTYKDVEWEEQASTKVPEGTVIKQSPDSGEKRVLGDTVLTLTVSSGPPVVEVPDVIGASQDEAEESLEDAGFSVTFEEGDYSDEIEADHVLRQSPESGDTVNQGSTITLYLSKGPDLEPVQTSQEITVEVNNVKENPNGKKKKKKKKQEPVHVQIFYSDADHNHALYVDEDITETKTYTLDFTINPGETGHYQVLVDGEIVEDMTITYEEAAE